MDILPSDIVIFLFAVIQKRLPFFRVQTAHVTLGDIYGGIEEGSRVCTGIRANRPFYFQV